MRSYLKGAIYGIALGLVVTTPSDAFQIQTISVAQAQTCTIGWDQAAPDLASANAFKYDYNNNGGAFTTIAATCTGAASPFLCTSPLPVKTVGTHALTVRASETLSDGTIISSTVSTVLNYRVVNPPVAPANLRLILSAGGGS